MALPRVGFGYDIHRLAPGRRLIIGGVSIESSRGLVGHSDGDVVLHAVADALLGAAGLGDLGTHFPSDDPSFAGADSATLLARVAGLVRERGHDIGSVDVTIVAEEPRLAPHVAAMRRSIAERLGIDLTAVSVKSKTNEGLGPVGAGEAIAAMAVAVVARP